MGLEICIEKKFFRMGKASEVSIFPGSPRCEF